MIILSLLNGSRLYGTNDECSDVDVINVYVKHRKDYYLQNKSKIKRTKIKLNKLITYDLTYIDIFEFCRQLINCNPNFLIPVLSKSAIWSSPIGSALLEHGKYFISGEQVVRAFVATAQSVLDNRKDFETYSVMIHFLNDLADRIRLGANMDNFEFRKHPVYRVSIEPDKYLDISDHKANLPMVKNVLDLIINKED